MSETYFAFLSQREALNAQIDAMQSQARAESIAEIREKIDQFGLTPGDIFPPRKSNVVKFKGEIKYRNPETNQVWTGRGKPPNWIKGQEREQFLVAA